MNPEIQTSSFFYTLELMQYNTCPREVNSGLYTDPRYKMQSTAWTTNEYAVQSQSFVLNLLITSPSYSYYVPQVIAKQNVILNVFTRPNFQWDINCEWTGTMSRSTALSYYSQTFSSPTTTYQAEIAANVLLWMTLAFLILQLVGGCGLSAKGSESGPALTGLIAVLSRVAWFITLGIIFHRT